MEKCETIWVKIEDLKIIQLNTLVVYDDRYIKAKMRRYDDKVYANFCGLNLPENGAECQSFIIISIDSFTCLSKQILSARIFRQLCL